MSLGTYLCLSVFGVTPDRTWTVYNGDLLINTYNYCTYKDQAHGALWSQS